MSDGGTLLPVLERLFAGPRESKLTLEAFFAGLETRSYAFVIAALSLPNCIPTGIPLLSTVTGVPMLLLVAQAAMGRSTPTLPRFIGGHALPRGRLQDLLARGRPHIEWLEDMVHPRREWWVRGSRRYGLQVALTLMIFVLALPIPLDNLLPAWAILFFCMALLERDGVMAILGWIFTVLTILWTALLLIVGPLVVLSLLKSLF